MFKIYRPLRDRASLGCPRATLKKGVDRFPRSQRMALIALRNIRCIDYLAYGAIFTRVMFLPKKKGYVFLDFFSRQKSPRCSPGGGGTIQYPPIDLSVFCGGGNRLPPKKTKSTHATTSTSVMSVTGRIFSTSQLSQYILAPGAGSGPCEGEKSIICEV